DGLITKDRQHVVKRPNPTKIAIPPSHGLGPWEIEYERRNSRLKHFDRAAAWLVDHRKVGRAALYLSDFQFSAADGVLFAEAVYRGIRRALRWAFFLHPDSLSLLRHVAHGQCQAPRRRQYSDFSSLKTGVRHGLGKQSRQIVARLCLHPRRDFFGQDFEEKVSHAGAPTTRRTPLSPNHAPARYRPA